MRRRMLLIAGYMVFCATLLPAQNPLPDAPGATPIIYKAGGEVTTPKLVYSVDPEFSDEAQKRKFQGEVALSLVVDAEGNPQDVKVTHSLTEGAKPKDRRAARSLDDKAVAAVKQYRFKPRMLKGKPVPVMISITVNFQMF